MKIKKIDWAICFIASAILILLTKQFVSDQTFMPFVKMDNWFLLSLIGLFYVADIIILVVGIRQWLQRPRLHKNFDAPIVKKAMEYAVKCHRAKNHKYDGKPYESAHLQGVYDYGCKYAYLLPTDEYRNYTLGGCWTHDVGEDCGETYNDVKKACGIRIAEITYNLSNEKGKTRAERANDKYYNPIAADLLSTYVKVCDRLRNTKYSKNKKSSMFDKYVEEGFGFENKLYRKELEPMFLELRMLYSDSGSLYISHEV